MCLVSGKARFPVPRELPHQTGLPPDFSLECSIQSRLGAIQQHPFFGSGYTGVDNLPGEQSMVFIIGQDKQDVIKL
jgi:hypothetical protein